MPELPEVEAVCENLRRDCLGARIRGAGVLRAGTVRPQKPAEIEALLTGRRIEAVERRGKHILLRLSGGWVAHIHLRMTGNLYVVPDYRFRPAATRVYFELVSNRGLVFDDPRALGRLHVHRAEHLPELLAHVGLEPLSEEFTAAGLVAAARSSRKPAKLFLMDQKYVAGLGNIYAAEALFRARIDPARPMMQIRKSRLLALHEAIVRILEDAVQSARIAYSRPGSFGEAEAFPRSVYDREDQPCLVCRGKIRRITQGGRSTYYCPGCQR